MYSIEQIRILRLFKVITSYTFHDPNSNSFLLQEQSNSQNDQNSDQNNQNNDQKIQNNLSEGNNNNKNNNEKKSSFIVDIQKEFNLSKIIRKYIEKPNPGVISEISL